jgi:predicted RNase H-like HicB family nuclease
MTNWLEVQPGLGRYTVEFRPDEDGRVWLAQVSEVPPCHTFGGSPAQALERVREALGLFVDDAGTAELVTLTS